MPKLKHKDFTPKTSLTNLTIKFADNSPKINFNISELCEGRVKTFIYKQTEYRVFSKKNEFNKCKICVEESAQITRF